MNKSLYLKCSFLIGMAFVVLSCNDRTQNYERMVNEWIGKEIVFPSDIHFTIYTKDTVFVNHDETDYKIVSYIDSTGCVSCKLQLTKWQETMKELNEVAGYDIPYLFFFHPQDVKELVFLLRRDEFNYPVCIDINDEMNRRNGFPNEYVLQTFLLDSCNRVVLIGNPVANVSIKQLYKERLSCKTSRKNMLTEAVISSSKIDYGELVYGSKNKQTLYLKNEGRFPLVILDYTSSCGCTTVEYEKQPVQPGDSLTVNVYFKADESGAFRKTLKIYANIPSSSFSVLLTGVVKESLD